MKGLLMATLALASACLLAGCSLSTPEPSATATPTASATPSPSFTVTFTPSATATRTPSPSPAATDTPRPTDTPTATPSPTRIPVTPTPVPPSVTPTLAGPDVSAWHPRPLRIDCIPTICGFLFTVTFSAEGFHHRLEFQKTDGTASVIMGIESTFANYVAIPRHMLKQNLEPQVPYRWRVLLYQATDTGEVLLKHSEWASELYYQRE